MLDRHFIYTGGRSGSNYLVNLLNQHPEVVNYNEVLGSWTLPYKMHALINKNKPLSKEYLEYIYSSKFFFYVAQLYTSFERLRKKQSLNFKKINQVKTVGVKDFHYHLREEDNQLWLFFKNNKNLKIINLYRSNILKKYISLRLLGLTAFVANTGQNNTMKLQDYKHRKVYLDPENTLKALEESQSNLDQRMSRLKQISQDRVLHICYERLFESAASQDLYREQIFDFLGVANLTVNSKHSKLTNDNLEDVIENYQEIKAVLTGTAFEQFLE